MNTFLLGCLGLIFGSTLSFGQGVRGQNADTFKIYEEDELDAPAKFVRVGLSANMLIPSRVLKVGIGAKINFSAVVKTDGKTSDIKVTGYEVYFRTPGRRLDAEAADALRTAESLGAKFNYASIVEVEKKVAEILLGAATDAVKSWQYAPGKKDGIAVSFRPKVVSYHFAVRPDLAK